jgi:H+/Cl- antiporter ClcA
MSRRRLQLLLTIASLLLVFTVSQAFAQGCTQCLDSARATPPAVQAAYRHAILLLVSAASTLFLAGLILFRRDP